MFSLSLQKSKQVDFARSYCFYRTSLMMDLHFKQCIELSETGVAEMLRHCMLELGT